MGIVDWFRGYSTIREIHSVFLEDGVRFEPHAVIKYYNLKGKYIGASFGGELTLQEKRICEKNPEIIKRSPFSYVSSDELDLPLTFAKKTRATMRDGLSEKLN